MGEKSSWASSDTARRVMQGNRSRDTKPELAVRRLLHAAGLRYRVAYRPEQSLRRTADIVFPGQRIAVFIDGCYWHACPEHGTAAKSNVEYWSAKLQRNVERDSETTDALRSAGWTVLRFWEHESPEDVAETVIALVAERRCPMPSREHRSTRPGAASPGRTAQRRSTR